MIHSPSRRCWFQFSLGSLFWLTLLAATASYGLREYLERVRIEDELADREAQKGATGVSAPAVFSADLDIPFSAGPYNAKE